MPVSCGFLGSAYDMICHLLMADLAILEIKNSASAIGLRQTSASRRKTCCMDGKKEGNMDDLKILADFLKEFLSQKRYIAVVLLAAAAGAALGAAAYYNGWLG